MASNPLGPGTKNISVNVPLAMRGELERLAAASGTNLSTYVRNLLTEAAGEGVTYRQIRSKAGAPAGVAQQLAADGARIRRALGKP